MESGVKTGFSQEKTDVLVWELGDANIWHLKFASKGRQCPILTSLFSDDTEIPVIMFSMDCKVSECPHQKSNSTGLFLMLEMATFHLQQQATQQQAIRRSRWMVGLTLFFSNLNSIGFFFA